VSLLDDVFSSYRAKNAEISAAWDACEARFRALPAPLDALSDRFLASVSSGPDAHRAYFSSALAPPLLYMPLWLRDGLAAEGATGLDDARAMTEILAGTMQGYLYVRIQDDALDDPSRADPDLALFGNACLSGMLVAYGDALGALAPAFFRAFDRAFTTFSRHTHDELRVVRGGGDYPEALFEEHADKVAFARVPMLAVAALAGRADLEPRIAELVHRLGIAYGLTNDALGWPRDLRAGHRTHVLTLAGLEREELDAIAAIPEDATRAAAEGALAERMRGALYEGMLLRRVIARAAEAQRRAAEIARGIGLRGFEDYTADRLAWLDAFDRQALATSVKRALLKPSS